MCFKPHPKYISLSRTWGVKKGKSAFEVSTLTEYTNHKWIQKQQRIISEVFISYKWNNFLGKPAWLTKSERVTQSGWKISMRNSRSQIQNSYEENSLWEGLSHSQEWQWVQGWPGQGHEAQDNWHVVHGHMFCLGLYWETIINSSRCSNKTRAGVSMNRASELHNNPNRSHCQSQYTQVHK